MSECEYCKNGVRYNREINRLEPCRYCMVCFSFETRLWNKIKEMVLNVLTFNFGKRVPLEKKKQVNPFTKEDIETAIKSLDGKMVRNNAELGEKE